MAEIAKPRQAVENWERVRYEWLAEIDRVLADAERWSANQGWATLRDDRTLTEDEIGAYRAPVLLIHTMQGRVLLTPEARFVYGADGLIDLHVYPSFDDLASIVKTPEGWWFKTDEGELGDPWTEQALVKVVKAGLGSP